MARIPKRHGWFAVVDAGGEVVELSGWRHGKREGWTIVGSGLSLAGKTIAHVSWYRDGVRHGAYYEVLRATVVKQGRFENGFRHGCWHAWLDEPRWSGRYDRGKPINTWETWLRPDNKPARGVFGPGGFEWREFWVDGQWGRIPAAPEACERFAEKARHPNREPTSALDEPQILCLVTATQSQAECLAQKATPTNWAWRECVR